MKMISTKKLSIFFLLFFALLTICFSQSFQELYKRGLKLYEQNNYAEAEVWFKQALEYEEKRDSILFLLGMCSAFQSRLEEAEGYFLNALEMNNRCEQCYLELGGIYFRKKEHRKTEQYIKKAIKINPDNEYAHDFLGTLYYIKGLTILALYEWNKIDKPILANLSFEIDRANRKELIAKELQVNPGQMIRPSMISESRKRLDKIGNISNVSFNLVPYKQSPEDFDMLFSFYEERGFGKNLGLFLINGLKSIPLKTIHLDYKNILDRNINIYTIYRFDRLRKKFDVRMTLPRYTSLPFYTSLAYTEKNDVWSLENLLPDTAGREERIKTREFTIRFDYIHDDSISYNHYLKFKARDVPNDFLLNGEENDFLSSTVKNLFSYGGELQFNLVRNLPDNISSDFSVAYTLFYQKELEHTRRAKLLLTLENVKVWKKALSEEEKGRLLWRVMLGYSSDKLPLEDKFVLGIGPDASYYLRAHNTTRGGKLGNSPIVDKFVLSNLQYSHHLIKIFPFRIAGGLFLDCARVFGESSVNYKNRLIVDVGVFSEIHLFNFPFILSYGYNFEERIGALYLGSFLNF